MEWHIILDRQHGHKRRVGIGKYKAWRVNEVKGVREWLSASTLTPQGLGASARTAAAQRRTSV
ncbi:hypothetical protein PspLS_10225 [Pyricularia sp. CBS 133598]|nr:hypothetical protein PspLS_10225 [Pyricularia sp. CBS 133598]